MSSQSTFVRAMIATALLSPAALAQFNNQWARFAPDQSRLRDSNGAPAGYITSDPQEKDFAVGDLDQDGWVDLVQMRKQLGTTAGMYPNYLLMNEGGLLVDRSAQYASQTDVPGDNGFLTPTNDRDVVIEDINADGWLDVITATTLGQGLPKHISHPRVYVNLGNDANGNWLGLRFENNRIPTFNLAPRFCGVDAGDVTGDGHPDLYFSDYGDLYDKLLINDGNGFFSDSGYTRLTQAMLDMPFGTSAVIVDMNGDGHNDIVRGSGVTGAGSNGGTVSIAHNNPANVGFFPATHFQTGLGAGSTYHVDVGDLNNDGRPDIITTEDGADSHRYNVGNLPNGLPSWGPSKFYQFLTGGDDGFGGTALIADLDGDGWRDALIASVDVDLPSCGSRLHIYHNPGGAVGSQITLLEEAEAAGGGWRGVAGLLPSDATGTHDVAVFDLDNDGDLDMVIGRCSGTFVWLNQADNCPEDSYAYGAAAINSTGFPASISRTGSTSIGANDLVLTGTNLPANKTALYIYGTTRLWNPVPFGNGLRFIGGAIQRLGTFQTDANGNASYAANFTTFPLNALNAGDVRDFQLWFRDPDAGGTNYNASSALELVICP